jgi:hypothetical protein
MPSVVSVVILVDRHYSQSYGGVNLLKGGMDCV